MDSCLYEGRVQHRRLNPIEHQFRYSILMAYLDLEELPRLLHRSGPLTSRCLASVSFHREDHVGDRQQSLANSVRDLVESETGRRPDGPIRLLTHLRHFGYYFSPLNLYYCFARDSEAVEIIVAEVNNTPWREQHCYVLWDGNRLQPQQLRFAHAKRFHVSPFMDMDVQYRWRLSRPAERLRLSIENVKGEERFFSASMRLQKKPLNRASLLGAAMRHPAMTLEVMAAIYYQACRLWLKRCPFHAHPQNSTNLLTQRT